MDNKQIQDSRIKHSVKDLKEGENYTAKIDELKDFFYSYNFSKIGDKLMQPYRSDGELYILWKFINSNRLLDKNSLDFDNLTPSGWTGMGIGIAAATLITNLELFGIELEGIKFEKGFFLKYSWEKYEFVKNYIKEKPEEKISKAIQNVLKGNFSIDDLRRVCMFQKFGMAEYFEFNKPHQEKIKKISDYLIAYTECFIKDKLKPLKKNYYKFEKQKSILFYTLKKNIDKYGNIFVLYYPEHEVPFDIDEDYLFIHSLVALEYLRYIQVENIWIYDWETPPEKQTEQYKIRVAIQPKMLKEIEEDKRSLSNYLGQTQSFKKSALENKYFLKDKEVRFNSDESCLKIANQRIALPPYKNEYYFCQVMFEYKAKEPVSWDIIYDIMTGHSTVSGYKKPEPLRKNWQKVNDTMKRVNNRIIDILKTDDHLFSWSERTIIRNY